MHTSGARTRKGLIGVAATAALTLALAGCWLQPGFDAGRGNWNPFEYDLTSRTVGGGLTQRWNTTVLGVATNVNAPLSSRGRIYVTTSFGASASALDAHTGALLWTRDLFDHNGSLFGQSLTAPALVDGELVVGKTIDATHGVLYHLDLDTGAVLSSTPSDPVTDVAVAGGVPAVLTRTSTLDKVSWKFDAVVTHTSPSDSPGSFAIVGDHLLWSDGDKATGYSPDCPANPAGGCSLDWSTDLGDRVTQVVAVGHGQAIYSYGFGNLAVLDVATGAVRWTASVANAFPAAHIAAVADGVIVVAAPNFVGAPQLFAYPAAGCGASSCQPLWSAFGSSPTAMQSPLVAGGDLVWASGELPGDSSWRIHAFPLHGCGAPTCEPIASVPYGEDSGTAIVDDGQLIVGDILGQVMAFGLPDSQP